MSTIDRVRNNVQNPICIFYCMINPNFEVHAVYRTRHIDMRGLESISWTRLRLCPLLDHRGGSVEQARERLLAY